MTMLHLSRLAEDWILYSSEEFGWMELGDVVTSGSSLMPQKKNPDSLELIRGKSGRVAGCFHALMMTVKGLPLTYNRDMQEDKEPLFEAADQLSGSLEMARAVADSIALVPAKAMRAVEQSWVVATDLAEALARSGTPFHQAHRLVGALVLESIRLGREPGDWTAADLAAFSPDFTADFTANTDFAEADVDAQVLNLTRFPVFFPETREFLTFLKAHPDLRLKIRAAPGPSTIATATARFNDTIGEGCSRSNKS